MKFTFREFDSDDGRFLSPDDLFPSKGIEEFILKYGQNGLDALPDAADEDEQIAQLIEEMIQAGLVTREPNGQLRLTPRMLRGLQHRAFLDIFHSLSPTARDGHATTNPGGPGERTDGTKPYTFGDPVSELAMPESLRNAIGRQSIERAQQETTRPTQSETPPLLPLRITERDLEIHHTEAHASSALCILIDLSGSMMRYGRHIAAKRVALGMRALVREKFPNDTVDFVGFASTAQRIEESELPLVMPKPITTRDWEVRVRVPLDQADITHPHFTNLHHGLRVARQILKKRGSVNKQLFIITDGEPTAHLSSPFGGSVSADPAETILNLIYPPTEASRDATLEEAFRCASEGIRFASFALIEEYHGMDWVGFVDQLTRLTRGTAFYCTAGDLGSTIMESYLDGKRQKRPLA